MLLLHSLFKLVRRNQHAGTISRRRLKTVNRQVFIDLRTVVVNDPLRAVECHIGISDQPFFVAVFKDLLTDIPLPALGNVDKFFGRKKSCDFFDRDVG